MSDATKEALGRVDDAVRAYIAADGRGDLTTGWCIGVMLEAPDRRYDFCSLGPLGQSGTISLGIANRLLMDVERSVRYGEDGDEDGDDE